VSQGAVIATTPGIPGRATAALACVYAAAAVGLGAYAAHAAEAAAAERLALASQYLLFHSLAVLVLLARRGRLLGVLRWGMLAGVSLFSGSLVGAALSGWPTLLAPFGGGILILSWLLLGAALWRGEGRPW
jgi:uncharacterized membrane protein YgdD (TMEM256/DUF423 family)